MELDQFLVEAKALARPGYLLETQGVGEAVALWHDFDTEGRVVSLQHGGSWITLKTNSRLGPSVVPAHRDELVGRPLFARPYVSLPPVDAVFLLGSSSVAKYLEDNGWSRNEPFNENFKHPTPAAYERMWQESCPMFQTGVAAVAGGWLFPWADVEWDELIASELVVWTLKGADPWFDVIFQEGRYAAYEHVT